MRVPARTLRLATPKDAEPISALMHALSDHFLVTPDGPEAAAFFASTSPDAMRDKIASADRRCHVVEVDEVFAGFIVVRDGRYISQFFVAASFQGLGLGRLLWDAARAAGACGDFTVDSSLSAVPVYERLGFRATGPRQQAEGMAFVPMVLDASARLEQAGL